MPPPRHPKIYHIVHVDRLPSIVADGHLWCDAEVVRRAPPGTTIGMNNIKQRRLTELTLSSHPDLHVGDCVPFYFCPRSVMLYLMYQGNHPDLVYRGGQDPIIHLEADLHAVVDWANQEDGAGHLPCRTQASYYFEDRSDLSQLDEIDWDAVQARQWQNCKERKQAEFLLEHSFPFQLVERIGVRSRTQYQQVVNTLPVGGHQPNVEICTDWYY